MNSLGAKLSAQEPERRKKVVRLHVAELDPVLFETFFGVEKRVVEIQVELFGIGRSLKIPKNGKVTALGRSRCNVLELLEK